MHEREAMKYPPVRLHQGEATEKDVLGSRQQRETDDQTATLGYRITELLRLKKTCKIT